MANKDLNKAKAAKKDEFYTRLEDIELELKPLASHSLTAFAFAMG